MPNFKKNTSTFRMYGKSPMAKKLVGKQGNLPAELKAKIMAAPESPTKMYDKKSPAKKYKSDAMRKAVHASKAEKASPGKMYGKSPMKELTKEEIDKRIVAETAKLKTATQESATGKKSSTTTKKKVDWTKAPKMNTQARRDWYTKNKLAQDKTTKLKSTAPEKVASKKVTKVEPKKTVPKVAKVTKAKSRRELANERIAARRARRNAKLENFVSGLKPRSKAKK